MSLGTQFLSAVIEAGDRRALGAISVEWLNEEEHAIYTTIVEHVRQYGDLPSAHTLRQNRITLPRADEPVAYYIDRLPQRAIHTFYREQFPDLVTRLENRDVAGVTEALRRLTEFASLTGNRNEVRSMVQEVSEVGRQFRENRTGRTEAGITTGFPPLDEVTGGLLRADLWAVVGRPAMGKSYTLFHMANAAWQAGHSVLLVSMEMGVPQCARRILGMRAHLRPDDIRRSHVSSYAESRLYGAIQGMDGLPPMHIMAGDLNKTVGDVDTMVQELMPDVIYVDAGYLLSPTRERHRSSRREYLVDTMEELKGVTIRRNKPLVMTTQFSREVKKKTTRPDLSMIGETDTIGQLISVGIGITPGSGFNSVTRRGHHMMKNREGAEIQYETHFDFRHMVFDAIPGTEKLVTGEPWVGARQLPGSEDAVHVTMEEQEASDRARRNGGTPPALPADDGAGDYVH